MWKATKIELVKNEDPESYFVDFFTLKINDVIICNTIQDTENFEFPNDFQNVNCEYCGVEGCSPTGYLMVRKQQTSLLFLPIFHIIDEFNEFNFETDEGERECPPHRWFTDGILIVDGDELNLLFELIPSLSLSNIPEISDSEVDSLITWESLVRDKPSGFIYGKD